MVGTPDPDAGESGVASGPVRGRRSIVETWIELFADAGGLVRAEAALARAETAENLKAIGLQSAKLVAGIILLSVALIFLTVAGVVGVAHFVGLLPALLIISALCLLAGLLLLRSGQDRLAGQNILPERSLGRMSRDLDSIASRAAPPEHVAMPDMQGN